MIKSITTFLVIFFSIFWLSDLGFAGGVAAQRARSSASGQTPSGAQRSVLKGPNIDFGRQRATGYIPPRTKSVNLPTLPYEVEQGYKPPAPAEPEQKIKPVPEPPKKTEQYYPSSQVLTSSPRNSSPVKPSGDNSPWNAGTPSVPPAELAELFNRLDQSGELWMNINDVRMKALIVTRYVDLYGKFGVKILKPAIYYANLIDAMAQNNPRLLANPFDQVLRIVAILEYDYNSGEDKDALARSILGDPQAFVNNKKRLGRQ